MVADVATADATADVAIEFICLESLIACACLRIKFFLDF